MICEYCDLEHSADLARGLITCIEAAELLGFEIPPGGGKISSFGNPDERTPSLHVYPDDGGWYDFSAGEGGDVIDFVMRATGYEFSKALSQLIHRSLKAGREPGDVERQPVRQIVDFTDKLAGPHFRAVNGRYDWEQRLGLTLPGNVVALEDSLLIPHADQDGVYSVKVRSAGGAKSAWPGSQPTKRLYCMHGWSRPPANHVYVVEGESDAWSLQSVLPDAWVLALPSGASAFKRHWLEDLPEKVTLIFDNDGPGRSAREKWDRETKWSAKHAYVPQLAKDVRETLSRWPEWRPA